MSAPNLTEVELEQLRDQVADQEFQIRNLKSQMAFTHKENLRLIDRNNFLENTSRELSTKLDYICEKLGIVDAHPGSPHSFEESSALAAS